MKTGVTEPVGRNLNTDFGRYIAESVSRFG